MDPNVSSPQNLPQSSENQVFPGVSISPSQRLLLKQNLEKNRHKEEVVKDSSPEMYSYIFTRNYIIVSSVLIVVAFLVFGIIIYLQITRFVPQ